MLAGMFDDFEQQLRETLTHLYDPTFQPPELVRKVLAATEAAPGTSLQDLVVRAIARLEPAPHVPATARLRRLHALLAYRYVQELTQEETAERLGITPRHLRREQQRAVHLLAQRLWEQYRRRSAPVTDEGMNAGMNEVTKELTEGPEALEPAPSDVPSDPAQAWRSQVHRELASLQQNAPGQVADVLAAIQDVVRIQQPVAARYQVQLTAESELPAGVTSVHPSILRQILIMAVQRLAQQMAGGRIRLAARPDGDAVALQVVSTPAAQSPPNSEFIRETVAAQGGTVQIRHDPEHSGFHIRLPRVREVKVLVVDDNRDLVHVYRRYTERTRYRISHVAEGQRAFEAIATLAPDLIVLDVMLPDMDGWEVLTRLHEDPQTRGTPVVVCSVVRGEELALALGATLYVAKPVGRETFIQALELALARAGRPPAPGSPP